MKMKMKIIMKMIERFRVQKLWAGVLSLMFVLAWLPAAGHGQEARLEFDRRVIDPNLPGGYQVEVADVNGDRKPDIVALGGGTCAWYENPTWKKRIVTSDRQTPGIISTATGDIDGDGKAEIAIGYEFEMNEPTRGKLALAVQGRGPDDAWTLLPVANIGSVHRLRWGRLSREPGADLVVAPIFGPAARPPDYLDPATIVVYHTGNAAQPKSWTRELLAARPVVHAIEVKDHDHIGYCSILTADNLGVGAIGSISGGGGAGVRDLVTGARGEPPRRGSSEIHLGRFRDRHRFLATIEPWHGSEVVVYPETAADAPSRRFRERVVIDSTLADGHALWVADVDGDGDDEIFAGHRGKDHRVSMYDLDPRTGQWVRTVLDREIAAQDLRGGDLDGDGAPDVVAVGGSTHNVVWYHPRKR